MPHEPNPSSSQALMNPVIYPKATSRCPSRVEIIKPLLQNKRQIQLSRQKQAQWKHRGHYEEKVITCLVHIFQ